MSTKMTNAATIPAPKDEFEREPDDKLVAKALERAGLTSKGTPDERVKRLVQHYTTEENAGVAMAECSDCGHFSPAKTDDCAFCGSRNGDGPVSDKTPVPQSAIVTAGVVLPALPDDLAERDLDIAIERVKTHSREAAGAFWDIGNDVREIRDKRLYLARRVGSTPTHRTFEDFCLAELGMSAGYVRGLIKIAETTTREAAIGVGVAKMGLIARVQNPETRAQLMSKAPSTSVREVSAQVREVTKKEPAKTSDRLGRGHSHAGVPAEVREAKREEEDAPAPKRAPVFPPAKDQRALVEEKVANGEPEPRVITLAMSEGEHEVHFFARRKKPGDRRRAQDLADAPVARLRTRNGIEIKIRLFKGEKGIFGKIQVLDVEGNEEPEDADK